MEAADASERFLPETPPSGNLSEGLRSAAANLSSAIPVEALPGEVEGPGQRIGRYKLQERIGAGGCGAVYMAEQQEPVRRRVALKIIKLGMDTEQVIGRYADAKRAFTEQLHFVENDPSKKSVLLRGRAAVFGRLGLWKEAVADLEEVTQLSPDDHRAPGTCWLPSS